MKQTHSTSDFTSLCTSVLHPLNKQNHLYTLPSFITLSPYTLTSWRRISERQMFLAFKNRIAVRTSQSAGLVVHMVLYKALWHSNQFTERLGKHWGCGRGSDDSSWLSKISGQWPGLAEWQMVLTLKMTLVDFWVVTHGSLGWTWCSSGSKSTPSTRAITSKWQAGSQHMNYSGNDDTIIILHYVTPSLHYIQP
jgi:hypothetical protein